MDVYGHQIYKEGCFTEQVNKIIIQLFSLINLIDIGNGHIRGNSWKLMDALEKEGLYFHDLTLSSRDLWLVTLNGYIHVMPNVCF